MYTFFERLKLRYVYLKYFLPIKTEIMKKKSNNENFTRVSKRDAGQVTVN